MHRSARTPPWRHGAAAIAGILLFVHLPWVHAFDVVLVDSVGATIEVNAGTRVERGVRVANVSNEERFVRLQVRAATLGGGHDAAAIAAARSNADWFVLPTEPVSVPAGATVTIPYELRVPPTAEGSFWVELAVQPVQAVELDPLALTDAANIALEIVVSYAGVLYTDVAGTGDVRLLLQTPTIERTGDGAFELVWSVNNGGNRIAAASISWEAINLATGEITAEGRSTHVMYPGIDVRRREALGNAFGPGTYEVVVVADALRWGVALRQETLEVR